MVQNSDGQELRKYDAGIIELGLEYNNKMAIPPGRNQIQKVS